MPALTSKLAKERKAMLEAAAAVIGLEIIKFVIPIAMIDGLVSTASNLRLPGPVNCKKP
jgi:hypothetical protein